MSFSAQWLAEREPADIAARSSDLSRMVAARLAADRPVRAVDLGSDTGANARLLIPYVAAVQDVQFVDCDSTLSEPAPSSVEAWSARVGCRFAGEPGRFEIHSPERRCRVRLRLTDLNALVGAPFEG